MLTICSLNIVAAATVRSDGQYVYAAGLHVSDRRITASKKYLRKSACEEDT